MILIMKAAPIGSFPIPLKTLSRIKWWLMRYIGWARNNEIFLIGLILKIMAGSENTNGNHPFELFPFRRFWIASSAASGYGYVVGCICICFLLARSAFVIVAHRFRVLPFTASPSGCPLDLPCGWPSRTERFTEYSVEHLFRSVLLLHGTIPAFQLSCSPDSSNKLASLFCFRLLTQPSNERLAYFGLTEQVRFLFSSNLWLFGRASPRARMIRFLTQLRASPRFHYFKVTFYRWPDISKICDHTSSCKFF